MDKLSIRCDVCVCAVFVKGVCLFVYMYVAMNSGQVIDTVCCERERERERKRCAVFI